MPDDATPMVLGSQRGYRVWSLNELGELLPTSIRYKGLEAGVSEHQAICHCIYPESVFDVVTRCPVIPSKEGTCGFYAVHDVGALAKLRHYSVAPNLVLGSVQFFGRVLFGETGVMRGEKMVIEGLYYAGDVNYKLRRRCINNYGVAFVPSIDQLTRRWPITSVLAPEQVARMLDLYINPQPQPVFRPDYGTLFRLHRGWDAIFDNLKTGERTEAKVSDFTYSENSPWGRMYKLWS